MDRAELISSESHGVLELGCEGARSRGRYAGSLTTGVESANLQATGIGLLLSVRRVDKCRVMARQILVSAPVDCEELPCFGCKEVVWR